MKSKEEILGPYIFNEDAHGYEVVYDDDALKAMSEYAQQQSIAYHEWTAKRGYQPRLKEGPIPEWGWKRQENQIIWSNWISNDELYAQFIEHQQKQP